MELVHGKTGFQQAGKITFSPMADTRMAGFDETNNKLKKEFLETLPTLNSWIIEADCLWGSSNGIVLATLSVAPVSMPPAGNND